MNDLFLILETFIIFANDMTSKFDEIGSLFLKRRKELGLTQQQLGEKVGVTKSEISKIENGRGITFDHKQTIRSIRCISTNRVKADC